MGISCILNFIFIHPDIYVRDIYISLYEIKIAIGTNLSYMTFPYWNINYITLVEDEEKFQTRNTINVTAKSSGFFH